ncbi:MAG: thioredoxin family protein [Nitrososphaerales archaeon]
MSVKFHLSFMSRVVELNSSNFDSILRNSKRMFVDFWAPWCKPCVTMNPLIERVADRHNSIIFAKVNVEEHNDIATRYHISSIPSYVFFRDSHPSSSRIGAMSEAELEKMVQGVI